MYLPLRSLQLSRPTLAMTFSHINLLGKVLVTQERRDGSLITNKITDNNQFFPNTPRFKGVQHL